MTRVLFLLMLLAQTSIAADPCPDNKQFSTLGPFPIEFIRSILRSILNPITLDASTLREWDGQNSIFPCRVPFKATFQKNGKTVTFIAVTHTSNPVEPIKSDLKIVQEEIERIHPQGVFIESVTGGVMPSQAFQSISAACYQGAKFSCGEAAFAALIGNKIGAEVIGGEPVPSLLNESLSKKMNREEILAYRSTQAILTFKREGISTDSWPERFHSEVFSNIEFASDEWSYSKYQDWLNKNLQLKPSQVEDRWIEPRGDREANKLQRIAFQVDQIREPLILKVAETFLNKHDSTVIVYGASHYYKESPAYEKALGPAQITCLKE